MMMVVMFWKIECWILVFTPDIQLFFLHQQLEPHGRLWSSNPNLSQVGAVSHSFALSNSCRRQPLGRRVALHWKQDGESLPPKLENSLELRGCWCREAHSFGRRADQQRISSSARSRYEHIQSTDGQVESIRQKAQQR